MFFCLNRTLMCILSFYNYYWMFLRSKPILRKRKITTLMLLYRRNPDSILIVNNFDLPNFKYLMWVFGQALIINIPLLDEKIGHLQGKGQFFFLHVRNSSRVHHRVFCCQNIQRQWLIIFLAIHFHLYRKKCHRYNSLVLHYIEDEV
jgi:hypothetical protein